MNAIVVYESLWGNTAAVARAIAEGMGPDARALYTAEAGPEAVAGAAARVRRASPASHRYTAHDTPDRGPRCSTRNPVPCST